MVSRAAGIPGSTLTVTLLADSALTITNPLMLNGAITITGSNPLTFSGLTTLLASSTLVANNSTTLSGIISESGGGRSLTGSMFSAEMLRALSDARHEH